MTGVVDDGVLRNADADWDAWPVEEYVAGFYTRVHSCDAAIVEHHSAWYRELEPDSLECSLEVGAGPNLYPLMLAAGCSRRIDAVEPSAANLAYLRRQLAAPDPHWQEFYDRCRRGDPRLPAELGTALARVNVVAGGLDSLPESAYDLVSMHFVAESVTEDAHEFERFCAAFVRAARPGGLVVAAFMENMPRYRFTEAGPEWPGHPVDLEKVTRALESLTTSIIVERIEPDPDEPDYEHTGMLVVTARRRPGG